MDLLAPLLFAALAVAAFALMQWRIRRLKRETARVARALREREQDLRRSEARLEEFLVALENSPNGVILLDEHAAIEWCNQTAADHFGLDTERDRQQYVGNLIRERRGSTMKS